MSLEDDPSDIRKKAAWGLGLSPDATPEELGLNANALAQLCHYPSSPQLPQSVICLVTPFGELGVNSWYVRTERGEFLFDAGSDGNLLVNQLQMRQLAPNFLIYTHGHQDHIAGHAALIEAFPEIQTAGPQETPAGLVLKPNQHFQGWQVIDVDGHWPGALAYFCAPFLIVGDALFAGSIGKIPPHAYAAGLNRVRDLAYFPAQTWILPGHGPHSTLELELAHNPFLAI